MAKGKFNSDQYHDSYLISVDFSDWKEAISLVLFCPNAGEDWDDGQHIELKFLSVLAFGFEVSSLGEMGAEPLLINDIILREDSDMLMIWQQRLHDLAKRSTLYPSGIRSKRYSDIYHFSIDSIYFQGRAVFADLEGFHVICRGYTEEPIPRGLTKLLPRRHSPIIEGGDDL